MEVVYEGWLVKSPPERRIRRAKWRRRWFVLRPSGDVPQQYVLEYYTDQSYKKLKGTIDLDQCDQVDAGLHVEDKSKYMFDIKTSKRTYYLVADSEEVMNKWVDCICSVCRLRMQVEDDVSSVPEEVTPSPAAEQPEQVPSEVQYVTVEQHSSSNGSPSSSTSKEDSNPYIPISECITGKPVGNGLNGDIALRIPPPRPPVTSQPLSSQAYDVPQPVGDRTSPDPVMDSLCRIPQAASQNSNKKADAILGAVPPPRVNWNTHPKHNSLNGQVLSYDQVPPARPVSGGGTDTTSAPPYDGDTLGRAGLKIKTRATVAPPRPPKTRNSAEECYDHAPPARPVETTEPSEQVDGESIPPRPPKPANIRNRPGNPHETYDVPPPPSATQSLQRQPQEGYDVPPPVPSYSHQRPSQESYDIPRPIEQTSLSNKVPNATVKASQDVYDIPKPAELPSPSHRQPFPQPPKQQLSDSMYDFPKVSSPEVLGTTIPAPGGQRPRMHSYCNAPTGMFSNRETIFNYEYRPSLCTSEPHVAVGDDAGVADVPPMSASYANLAPSPGTPNLTSVPPAINRGLKPRKASDSSAPTIFPLAPAPVARNRSLTSFTKTRLRNKGDTVVYPDEDSWSNASESRRNSANEEMSHSLQAIRYGTGKKKGEIQYLDLDLDAETGSAQSPRSPERAATSATVYRTVDFLKTKAFNRTRQNVEESYRTHKDGEPCK
uniref:Putative pleckstrin similarity domain protein n=1 Tax=Ornithodoros turicata TaxID=34597 RepID=A0A2R5L4S5_9ACAR